MKMTRLLIGLIVLFPIVASGNPDGSVAPGESEGVQIRQWVQQLGDPDFKVRERAFEQLKQLGPAARSHLEAGMKSEDPEIQWRSKRLMNLLDLPEAPRRPEKPAPERAPRLLERFRTDPFDWSFRSDDFFRDFRFPGVLRGDERLRELFERFDRQREEIQREMNRLLDGRRNLPRPESHASMAMTITDGYETLEFRCEDGKGATAKVTRDEEGVEVVDTFEAEDLESFKKSFPDLSARLGLDEGSVFQRIQPPPSPRMMPDRQRLGILCGEVPAIMRKHLRIEEGRGILVDEVEIGSAAARIGLQEYDIVTTINGRTIGRPEDIRACLDELKDGTLRIEILRSGRAQTLEGKF